MLLVGIDLAWGDKNSDGGCFIRHDVAQRRARLLGYAYPHGDAALVAAITPHLRADEPAFAAIDAPLVCPNLTGTRPVDRLTHTLFHREHAACHPANLTKCPRPPRVLARLAADLSFAPGWSLPRIDNQKSRFENQPPRLAAEVYPHPAMVRLFRLPRILKYKKGPVAARRLEFRRLQRLIAALLATEFPFLALDADTPALLAAPWTKPVEDRTDALFCALIALWHVHYAGTRSEIIGDLATGFILLPAALPPM
jgi:predicted RNase H-like nuclease